MRRQEPQLNPNDHPQPQIKLNQTLLPQSYSLLFLLIALALFVNTARGYDYNVVIGCGIYFLSSKNPVLHKMFYFYMLVGLTMVADGISIALLHGKVSLFHWLVAPVVAIVLKLLLMLFEGLRWAKEAKEENQRKNQISKQDAQARQQVEKKRTYQMEQHRYLANKLEKQPNPSSYYAPKTYYDKNHQSNFKNQPYKEFDNQKFVEDEKAATSQRKNQNVRR